MLMRNKEEQLLSSLIDNASGQQKEIKTQLKNDNEEKKIIYEQEDTGDRFVQTK